MNAKLCAECGRNASRLRRDRCDACYMRLYRGGEVTAGAKCSGCDERRRELLCHETVGGVETVVCGNCALVLRRTRPVLATVSELRRKMTRERRARELALPATTGRRAADRTIPAAMRPRPSFDVSVD
jgi:hypothetical protein